MEALGAVLRTLFLISVVAVCCLTKRQERLRSGRAEAFRSLLKGWRRLML